ncbi:hypothetical protein G6F57_018434 [Rhizopus arrhizus]|nr:hypothetical protein G6F57_018434 [Rhizopus arrhizus]
MRGGLPAARVVEDEVAHATLGFRLRMPQPGADEAFARLQVHVERGRGHFAATLMEQPRTLPGLVGRFVVGKTRVAMDAEQRATDAAGIGAEMVADLGQRRLKVAEQAQERLPHVVFVLLAVVVEPCLFVLTTSPADAGPSRAAIAAGPGAAHRQRRSAREPARQARAVARPGRAAGRRQVPRRIRRTPEGRAERAGPGRWQQHRLHRRAAHHGLRGQGRRRDGRGQHAQAGACARRTALHRRAHAG